MHLFATVTSALRLTNLKLLELLEGAHQAVNSLTKRELLIGAWITLLRGEGGRWKGGREERGVEERGAGGNTGVEKDDIVEVGRRVEGSVKVKENGDMRYPFGVKEFGRQRPKPEKEEKTRTEAAKH